MTKMGILTTFDKLVWALTMIFLFIFLYILGGGYDIISWYPDQISQRGIEIKQYYDVVYFAGTIVSALFVGTFFFILFRFWDRTQPAGIE
jgi:hypothetical protein